VDGVSEMEAEVNNEVTAVNEGEGRAKKKNDKKRQKIKT
jgi:hypothetical protein